MNKCRYNKCDGSGLLPFISKDGKVRKDAHIFCDCHPQYGIDAHEYYHPLTPDDIDFPVSYSFYRSLCQLHDWPDPGPCEPIELVKEPQVIFKPRPIDKELEQLKAGFLYLQNKVNEHLDKARQRQKSAF